MPRTLPRWLKLLLPFVGLTFLVYLVYTLHLGDIVDAILSIDVRYIFAALALAVPVLILRIFAWQWICRAQDIHIGSWRLLKIYLIGLFYGVATPGYLGQLMRVPYMKEDTEAPYGKLFVNVVLETFVHTLSLYVMMVIGAILIVEMIPQLVWLTVVWIVGVLVVFVLLVKRERGDRFFQWLVRVLVPGRVRGEVRSFTESFYLDFPRLRLLVVPLVVGAVTWVLTFSQEYCIVLALGLPIPYVLFLLVYPVANVAGFLPVSIAGLGTRELTAVALFTTLFAVSGASVFVVSVVGFIVTDVFFAGIGFVLSLTEARPASSGLVSS